MLRKISMTVLDVPVKEVKSKGELPFANCDERLLNISPPNIGGNCDGHHNIGRGPGYISGKGFKMSATLYFFSYGNY